uniref:Uncharacterized protein n=1 Tax=Panagrolaimus superbus TaxID=310955 RepID=A0A914YQ10_9BILA
MFGHNTLKSLSNLVGIEEITILGMSDGLNGDDIVPFVKCLKESDISFTFCSDCSESFKEFVTSMRKYDIEDSNEQKMHVYFPAGPLDEEDRICYL